MVGVVYNPTGGDLMTGVASKTKAAMTRLYNKNFSDSIKAVKKKKGSKVKTSTVGEDGYGKLNYKD